MAFLLKEDGDKLLKEDGGAIIIDNDLSAIVSPVVINFVIPVVTATYVAVFNASVTPVVAHFNIPIVTSNVIETISVIAPSVLSISKTKFTFIVESRNPHFRYATENWDFDEISREINGSMMVRIKTDQLTTDIANAITNPMNRITIRLSTEHTGSQGLPYFSGYIPSRLLNLQADNQSIDITAFGFASRLFDIPYRTGTTIAINKTGGAALKASELVADVIDKTIVLDSLWPVNYTATSIEDSVDDIQDIFVLLKAGEVINKAALLAYDANRIWHWTILGDNVFRFKKDSATADHQFVYGREVLSFPTFSEDLQQSRNEVLVVYNGGANIKRVADAASITLYGLRGDTINETNIPDAPTATELGNAYLASRVPPIRDISVTIGGNYPNGIENINPGDTCRIDNLPIDIAALVTTNMFIVHTNYKPKTNTVELRLSLKSPFINNKIEIIRRRLEQESVADSSATTYS
jgi:hypothetical protein